MWQRIQTVFLGITILALLISLVLPVWQGQAEGTAVVLTPFYLLSPNEQYIYIPYCLTAVLVVAGITLAVIEIRRYDNRMLQIKLGALNTLILAGAMVCVAVFTMQLAKQYSSSQNGIGMYLIFVAVLCNWLAVRFIRRDERLVKDSDRLR